MENEKKKKYHNDYIVPTREKKTRKNQME